MTKTYIFSDGKKAVFEYDHNGVGKITLECMNMLMGQLIAYKRCIQSRSFWDGKHCDDCMFYDDCPFNPREDGDEPNSSEKPNNCETQNRLDKCYKCKWWNYSYGCKCKKGICEFEPIVCVTCKWGGDKQVCGRCRSGNLYAPKDEPQTERYCTNCKHNGVVEDYECRECHGMDKHEFIEPQTDCSWK